MDAGVETIEDPTLVTRLRAKAKAVHRRALAIAAAITTVVLLFP
jgi:hypothetical protein